MRAVSGVGAECFALFGVAGQAAGLLAGWIGSGAGWSLGFDAGGERDAGDGEADHLTLAAAKAADRIAHEDELNEV